MNLVSVALTTESGCDPSKGEYSATLISTTEGISLPVSRGLTDDSTLIVEAIENDIDWSLLPEEGTTEITLALSGEWEGTHWHSYFRLLKVGDKELLSVSDCMKIAKEQEAIAKALSDRIGSC